jgi:hypothetical protein
VTATIGNTVRHDSVDGSTVRRVRQKLRLHARESAPRCARRIRAGPLRGRRGAPHYRWDYGRELTVESAISQLVFYRGARPVNALAARGTLSKFRKVRARRRVEVLRWALGGASQEALEIRAQVLSSAQREISRHRERCGDRIIVRSSARSHHRTRELSRQLGRRSKAPPWLENFSV